MCHHQRHRYRHEAQRTTWAAPPVRTPEPRGPIRAGDADRERVVEALRVHAGAGRIDADELERRIVAAYAATHLSDLDAVLAELPPLPRAATRARPSGRGHGTAGGPVRVLALLAAVAALIVVTTLTGVYALWWLMWPIAVALRPRGSRRRLPRPEAGPRPAAG